jgi:hypothetical protein
MEIVAAGRFAPAEDGAALYTEHLRVPALSVGTYSIPAGGTDDQAPHAEDMAVRVFFAPAYSGRG